MYAYKGFDLSSVPDFDVAVGVFKLGISILLLGFGFRLPFLQSSNAIPDETINNITTSVVENFAKLTLSYFVGSPKELNQSQLEDNDSEKCNISDGEWIRVIQHTQITLVDGLKVIKIVYEN